MKNVYISEKRKSEILSVVDGILKSADFNGKAVDVVKLCNRSGFIVFQLKEDANVDGVIIGNKNNGSSNLIAYKRNLTEKQNRFIIAHELGHYFLHFDNSHFNKDGVFVYAYHSDNSLNKELESEADFFAASLLLPKDVFIDEVNKLGELKRYPVGQQELSDIFNVSIDCIKLRLEETNAL